MLLDLVLRGRRRLDWLEAPDVPEPREDTEAPERRGFEPAKRRKFAAVRGGKEDDDRVILSQYAL